MQAVFEKLQQYKDKMEFNTPISAEASRDWQRRVPAPLLELYHLFNGGEILVPGTRIFGLTGGEDDIIAINNSDIRAMFAIPESYLIFAKLNFGDYICINRETPFDVIQWDHENNEEYDSWDLLGNWLAEHLN